jgi:hypothetical protein
MLRTGGAAQVPVFPPIRRLASRFLISLLILLPIACGPREEKRLEQPAMSADDVARKALEEYDTNNDGFLSAEELDRCPALKNSMELLDTNKDGKLSAEEIAARIRYYQELKVALISVRCAVTLDGKPLPGATVTFVPEKFMGMGAKPGTGITDSTGKAMLALTDPPAAGMNLGFYKIAVSLKDATGKETLPARYNSQTTLGQEIAPDVAALKGALPLALTSY